MGETRTYTCDKCTYSVEMSGGKDRGFDSVTQTFECTSCKILVDVSIGKYDEPVIELKPEHMLCPSCKMGIHLIKWNAKTKKCPKCEGKMKVDPNGIITLWD